MLNDSLTDQHYTNNSDQAKQLEYLATLQNILPQIQKLDLGTFPAPLVFRFSIEPCCLLSWLKAADQQSFFYFRSRNQQYELAGLTDYSSFFNYNFTAPAWEALLQLHPQADWLRIFFCENFSENSSWQEFKHTQFFLPSVFCERIDNKYFQTFLVDSRQINSSEELIALYQSFADQSKQIQLSEISQDLPSVFNRQDTPNYDTWCLAVNTVLNKIEQAEVTKVVLARQSNYQLSKGCDVFALANRLMQLKQNVYNFIYSPKADQYFLGGTPERLFSFADKVLITEALAGTSADEDYNNSANLFSDKNLHEHNVVVAGLKKRLQKLGCTEIEVDQPRTMQLANMQHLHSSMRAKSDKNLVLHEIINALHPTSAVCGEPKDLAAALILELEPFTRGLYAGPIGVASSQSIECAVALRSCLLQENILSVFAGAGIVAGSDPKAEWAELDTKISTILQLFQS